MSNPATINNRFTKRFNNPGFLTAIKRDEICKLLRSAMSGTKQFGIIDLIRNHSIS